MEIKKLDRKYISEFIRPRPRDCNKGDFGKLLCITGSDTMRGAGIISAKAALRSGAGLCTVASVDNAVSAVLATLPEATCVPLKKNRSGSISCKNAGLLAEIQKKYSAVLIGCGLSVCPDTEKLIKKLLPSFSVPVILDADGINIISGSIDILKSSRSPLILTPHMKEMSRLISRPTEEIKKSPETIASDFAVGHGVYLVLKDFETCIATPNGRVFKNTGGHPCMAKGGSGDMLAGIISSFAAQGLDPADAACAGVFIHSLAGEICARKMGDYSVLASDMINSLPKVFCSFLS